MAKGDRARLRGRRGSSAARPCPQSPRTPGIWNPLPYFDDVQPRRPAEEHHRRSTHFFDAARGRHAAGGQLGHPLRSGQRAPRRPGQRRPVLRHRPGQRRDARPGLVLDRDLPDLGRLGRLLRPRRAARGRPQRLWPAGARHRHQPVRPTRLHRPPDAELRRLPQVHRGPLPARPTAGPGQPTAGPTPARRCARTRPSSATSWRTSTSANNPCTRCVCRCIPGQTWSPPDRSPRRGTTPMRVLRVAPRQRYFRRCLPRGARPRPRARSSRRTQRASSRAR